MKIFNRFSSLREGVFKAVFPRRLSHLEFALVPSPVAMTAFGAPEGYFCPAIIAFGAFELIVPNRNYRFGKMKNKGSRLLNLRRSGRSKKLGRSSLTYSWSSFAYS